MQTSFPTPSPHLKISEPKIVTSSRSGSTSTVISFSPADSLSGAIDMPLTGFSITVSSVTVSENLNEFREFAGIIPKSMRSGYCETDVSLFPQIISPRTITLLKCVSSRQFRIGDIPAPEEVRSILRFLNSVCSALISTDSESPHTITAPFPITRQGRSISSGPLYIFDSSASSLQQSSNNSCISFMTINL